MAHRPAGVAARCPLRSQAGAREEAPRRAGPGRAAGGCCATPPCGQGRGSRLLSTCPQAACGLTGQRKGLPCPAPSGLAPPACAALTPFAGGLVTEPPPRNQRRPWESRVGLGRPAECDTCPWAADGARHGALILEPVPWRWGSGSSPTDVSPNGGQGRSTERGPAPAWPRGPAHSSTFCLGAGASPSAEVFAVDVESGL